MWATNKMSIVCAFVMVCAVCAQDQATIKGDSNKIEMKVPGATLTLQSDSQQGEVNDTWKTSYVASDLLSEAVTQAVNTRIDAYSTTESVTDAIQDAVGKCVLKDDEVVGLAAVSSKTFLTSVVLTNCNTTVDQKKACPSGDANVTAMFYGFGLVVGIPDLYTCVLTVDGVEHVSKASVVSVQDNAGRQQVTCALAAGVHPDDVEFDGSLTLREGGVLNIPSVPWNPLIQFYNTGPTIETISFEFLKGSLPVAGPASVLESDKRTVPVQLVFADFLDDASTLDASFKSLTTTPLPDLSKNFDLDMDTQVLRLTFDFNWMSNFLNGDPAAQKLISFEMTLTDSGNMSTTKQLMINLTLQQPHWSQDGNSDKLSSQAREAIMARAGKDTSAQFTLCYDMERDGWSPTTFHSKCDNKGPLLMFLRRKGSDRFFGGYNYIGSQGGCGYVNGGILGDVQPGQSAINRGWLFRVLDATPNAVQFAYQKSHTNYMYYTCSNSYLTWGGGHDFYCRGTTCGCNLGFSYRTVADNDPPNDWCTGTQTFSTTIPTNAFDFYEVYSINQ
eukprot:m.242434 g.242434  ORF g.242434 m.242434 type:complete len:558 (+) comp33795_c0_seq8:104-1777(+)